jgi:hypothetical protein
MKLSPQQGIAVSDVVPFPGAKKRRKIRAKKHTLCKNGHHKWTIDNAQRFDVKQGKLVTVERCARCNEARNKLN